MLKRVVLIAAAFVLALPGVAMANGVNFGFTGGQLAFGLGPNGGTTLTTSTTFGGYYSTLTFVGPIPAGTTGVSGSNLGDVHITTGEYDTVNSTSTAAYFGTGGIFSIVSDATIGPIPAGTVLFSGTFTDMNTTPNAIGPNPGAPAGTGAVWSSMTCPAGFSQLGQTGQTCARLYGSLTGNLDPTLLAWLGLGSGPGATGWVANIDIIYSGSIYITHGDAQLFVPEPATLALFGTGLIGIAGLLRRKISQ